MASKGDGMIEFPDLDDLPTVCEWYAAHVVEIQALAKELRKVERRVEQYILDVGPIRTVSGLLRIEPDGHSWDDEALALAMPSLIVGKTLTVSGPKDAIEEVLSTVVAMPAVEYTLARRLDHTAANSVVREGGAAGAAVEACRSPRGRLGLR